ncbi:MAG: ComF family protein [bacterium]|nr:ComF family protein [bacterium]
MLQSRWAAKVRARILETLFPSHCVGCAERGSWLCAACLSGLRQCGSGFCPGCLRPSTDGRPCLTCVAACPLTQLFAACPYRQNPLARAVESLKYTGVQALADPLAELLIAHLEHFRYAGAWSKAFDAVIPVPLHRRRLLARGYQQAALLAVPVAQHFSWPLREDVLFRVRATRPQVGLPQRTRLKNVRGAFSVSGMAPRRVLLVDDVVTTASTMRACAQALRDAGSHEVVALALAHG